MKNHKIFVSKLLEKKMKPRKDTKQHEKELIN
jgi:hypothetical protein